MENKPASSLVVFLGKALNGIASTFWVVTGSTGSNRWQLDSKTKNVPLQSSAQGNLLNKWARNKCLLTHL